MAKSPKRRRYRNPFLVQVIGRVDFAAPIQIPHGPPKEVVASFKRGFPIAELKKITQETIELDKKDIHTEIKYEHMYANRDRTKFIRISEQAATIEYGAKSYESFEGLLSEFLPLVASLFKAFENLQIRRLGLRYVDNIEIGEGSPTDWRRYLSFPTVSGRAAG